LHLRHDPTARRFVADLGDGAQAILEYRPEGEGVLDYFHTYVPPAFRGRGIAGALVEFALEHARAQGLRVRPTCPFVARVIDSGDTYTDLRAT